MLITQLRHHVEISLWLTLEGRNDHAYRQGRKNGRKNICRLLKSYTTHCLKIAQKVSISQNQPKLEFWFFVKNLNFPPKLNLWNQWELGPILVKKWDIFGDFATLWQFWRKSDTLIFLKSDQNMVIPIVFWPLLLATVGQAGGQKDIRSSSYFSYVVLLMDKSD